MTTTPNPADLGELVERLRDYRPLDLEWGNRVHHVICDEAADAIAAHQREIEGLRGHIACMEAGHAESREQFSEARDKLQADLHANIARATALQAKVRLAAEALGPFKGVYKINEPLSEGWPDDKPNSEFIPGAWPDWNDFRRASAIHAELTQEGGK